MEAWQKWAAHRPRAGQTVVYRSDDPKWPDMTGTIIRVEHERAWVDYGDPEPERFTWCFPEKLNSLHEWPTKGSDTAEAGDKNTA